MKVINCFPFFNEIDILKIHLHELDPWIDYFVLVESTETHTGITKPLIFKKNIDLYEEFLPKIIHLESPPAVDPENAWDRCRNQWDYIGKVLPDFSTDEDILLIGDVDEIPNGRDFVDVWKKLRRKSKFVHQQYIYYMNLQRPGGWPGTVILSHKMLREDYNYSLLDVRLNRRKGGTIPGGWHFTKMGGIKNVIKRMKSSCHHNSITYNILMSNMDILVDRMEGSRIVKGRELKLVPIDETYPAWFVKNINEFKHLLAKE